VGLVPFEGVVYTDMSVRKFRAHKFGAVRTEVDGIKFSSKKEARRFVELRVLQVAGEISFFLRQVPFHLPGGVKYVADFVIFWADETCTVEDVKGRRTPEYIAKKKMVEAEYPITITET
jgi:hypothetical protein